MWIMKLVFFCDSIQISVCVVGADLWKLILLCIYLGYNVTEII